MIKLDVSVGFVLVRGVVLVTPVAAPAAALLDGVEPTSTAGFDAVFGSDHALVSLFAAISNAPTEFTAALAHISRY
jgi:hypothetical protein